MPVLIICLCLTETTAQCDNHGCIGHDDLETFFKQEGIPLTQPNIPKRTLLRSSSTNHVSPARVEFILTHDGPALLGMTESEIENNILQLGNFFETCNSLANFDHPGVEVANLHVLPNGGYDTERKADFMIGYAQFDNTIPNFGDPAFK